EEPAANAQRVGDVPHDEVPWLVAGVDLAVEILAGAGGGEKLAAVVLAGDRRADGKEFVEAAELAQFGGDAGDAVGAVVLRLLFEALDRGVPALNDQLGEVGDLAAGDGAQAAGNGAAE